MSRNIFSEDKGIVDDAFQNAAGVDEARTGVREDVRDVVVQGGVLLTADCPYCGIQWRGIIKWPEICGFFLGQQVPNTQATQGGISLVFGCRKCGRASPMTMTWDNLDQYVAKGVKMKTLPPTIYKAREQEIAKRAAAQRR